jgi:hypothetical protein
VRDDHQTRSHSACLESWCANGTVMITVGETNVTCPKEGGPMAIKGFVGKITCPAAKDFCKAAFANDCPSSCNGIGRCFNGKCYCPLSLDPSSCDLPTFDCRVSGCSENGKCYPNGKCQCNTGFEKFDCSEPAYGLKCDACGGTPCYGSVCDAELFRESLWGSRLWSSVLWLLTFNLVWLN